MCIGKTLYARHTFPEKGSNLGRMRQSKRWFRACFRSWCVKNCANFLWLDYHFARNHDLFRSSLVYFWSRSNRPVCFYEDIVLKSLFCWITNIIRRLNIKPLEVIYPMDIRSLRMCRDARRELNRRERVRVDQWFSSGSIKQICTSKVRNVNRPPQRIHWVHRHRSSCADSNRNITSLASFDREFIGLFDFSVES